MFVLTIICLLVGATTSYSTNLVVTWNTLTLNAIRATAASPTVSSRVLAIVNVAIYDAVASISPEYLPYNFSVPAPPGASLEAAVISAARYSLVYLFPSFASTFDAQYFSDMANLRTTLATTNGIYVGEAVANAVIADRNIDGSSGYVPYPGSDAPGMWRPTPPSYLPAETPQWATEQPWCLTFDAEFLAPPPPALDNETYISDHNEIYKLGSLENSSRTPEQTLIANFWYGGPSTDTPPGMWATVAAEIAIQQNFSIPDSAHLFALTSIALADAAISVWNSKYDYGFWRPITAIQLANTTDVPELEFDPSWEPLKVTPNWPEYPSDRAMFGGAASSILALMFGDNYSFYITDDVTTNTTRNFTSFSSAAFEEGQSRVYAGNHFNNSVMVGLRYGQKVANWTFHHCLLPAGPAIPIPVNKQFIAAWLFGAVGMCGVVAIGTMIIISKVQKIDDGDETQPGNSPPSKA